MPQGFDRQFNERRRLRLSAALVSLVLLSLVNFGVGSLKSVSREKTLDPHRSDAYAVNHFYQNKEHAADIALLGSSLVEVAAVQAAAIGAQKPIDRLSHRNCEYFDRALQTNLGITASSANLAIGGAMVSDAYLVTKHLLVGRGQPSAIIYGISPRDFQDNMMCGVETSEAFRLLYAADDLPEVWVLPSVNPETKLALSFAALSPMWQYRDQLSKLLLAVLFPQSQQPIVTLATNKNIVPADGPLKPGESVWQLSSEHQQAAYRIRYNPPSATQYKTQFGYFAKMLALCAQRHIPLLVINMPISDENKTLMPPQLYERYLAEAQTLCRSNNVQFYDLNKHPLNDTTNFLEAVHLNPHGSTAFFDALVSYLGRSTVKSQLGTLVAAGKSHNL